MNKIKVFFLQLVICILVVSLLGAFFVARERNCWERIYKNSDNSVVEIYTLDLVQDDVGVTSGTGFVYSLTDKCVILTNRHVMSVFPSALVRFRDGIEELGSQVDASELHDLAVLEVKNINLKRYGILRPGRVSDLQIGEELMTIGHPRLESHHISIGFYTGKSTDKNGLTLLRLSMAVDPGNSGGPLFNRKGQVVGIISRKIEESANIAFAIPIDKVEFLSFAR
jgi:serine protease Do